jgi:hypothetical protein
MPRKGWTCITVPKDFLPKLDALKEKPWESRLDVIKRLIAFYLRFREIVLPRPALVIEYLTQGRVVSKEIGIPKRGVTKEILVPVPGR